jgi:hypothetical protein
MLCLMANKNISDKIIFGTVKMKNRRIFLTCSITLLVSFLFITCVGIFSGWYFLWRTQTAPTSALPNEIVNQLFETTDSPAINSKTTPAVQTDNSSNTSINDRLDQEIIRQMDDIQLQVILERGLKPSEEIDRILYSREQLREKISQDFFKNYSEEDARNEAITLASFGLITPDYDLRTLYTDLYTEQVAGFFDIETNEMVVVQGESFSGVEKFVYAHEYTHALQDQNFDIEKQLNFNDEACEHEAERCTAVLALIEGDATLTQLRWFLRNATPEDQAKLMEMVAQGTDSPIFDSAPEFISLSLTFPYDYGYLFVDHLYKKGGWGTVDRVYQVPPTSTEQILHPERYPDDKPLSITLPALNTLFDSNWEEIDKGVLGEWSTYLFLAKGLDKESRLDEDVAWRAVEGWGGDAYIVLNNPSTMETVLVLKSIWDSETDAAEFAESFRVYADGRFDLVTTDHWKGNDGTHLLQQALDTTTWIMAPDSETAFNIMQIVNP